MYWPREVEYQHSILHGQLYERAVIEELMKSCERKAHGGARVEQDPGAWRLASRIMDKYEDGELKKQVLTAKAFKIEYFSKCQMRS